MMSANIGRVKVLQFEKKKQKKQGKIYFPKTDVKFE